MSDQVRLIFTHHNSQQFALVESRTKPAFIEVELSVICPAIWVNFNKDFAGSWKANGPELHGERTDWSDHDVFHGFAHQGTIEVQTLAIGSHRSRDQQPIALEDSNLHLSFVLIFKVKIENYDGCFHVAMDFQLTNCLHHCFTVDVAIQLHYFLRGQSSITQAFDDLISHFFGLELKIIVETRSTSIGYAQNGRSVFAIVVSYDFHEGIIVTNHNYEVDQLQVLLIGLHRNHCLKLMTKWLEGIHFDVLSEGQELLVGFMHDLKG